MLKCFNSSKIKHWICTLRTTGKKMPCIGIRSVFENCQHDFVNKAVIYEVNNSCIISSSICESQIVKHIACRAKYQKQTQGELDCQGYLAKLCGESVWQICLRKLFGKSVWENCLANLYLSCISKSVWATLYQNCIVKVVLPREMLNPVRYGCLHHEWLNHIIHGSMQIK